MKEEMNKRVKNFFFNRKKKISVGNYTTYLMVSRISRENQ
jgi:hypothetical protein